MSTALKREHRIYSLALGLLCGFVALTAIGGGIAMLVGADRFPAEWLKGTLFPDYMLLALVLAVVVGGSALVAAVTAFTRRASAAPASMVAGLLLVGYILVEVAVLKQVPPGPTPIEWMYLALGLVIFGAGGYEYLHGGAGRGD